HRAEMARGTAISAGAGLDKRNPGPHRPARAGNAAIVLIRRPFASGNLGGFLIEEWNEQGRRNGSVAYHRWTAPFRAAQRRSDTDDQSTRENERAVVGTDADAGLGIRRGGARSA